MWFMYILSWLALLIQISVVTLSIAAGLFYLAELVEEYTVFTAKFCTTIYILLFLFEDYPLSIIICGLGSNVSYFFILKQFPYFSTVSPSLIIGTASIFINHYLAFAHFSEVWYPFSEVLAYFTLCLWLVPFAFFVSLSANENVLPTVGEVQPVSTDESDVVSNYFRRKGKKYGLLSFFRYAQDSILPQRMKKQF
ncbi:protein TEX261-like isoform X2 [Gigantopelta aegis]|uniref:protein TEX261-like isoform X2 n=1 Tax=Gigantopelta aegis TaxID=1735272 RepID=UPI001B887617|nr:protein TEX261-like isoform X2 [Gigantopelta aegis]